MLNVHRPRIGDKPGGVIRTRCRCWISAPVRTVDTPSRYRLPIRRSTPPPKSTIGRSGFDRSDPPHRNRSPPTASDTSDAGWSYSPLSDQSTSTRPPHTAAKSAKTDLAAVSRQLHRLHHDAPKVALGDHRTLDMHHNVEVDGAAAEAAETAQR